MNPNPTSARRGPKPRPHVRDNLVAAGARMLHEAGYAATGVKDIVDAAGVPKGSFYNYFASKEDFAAETVDHYFGRGLPGLRAALEDESVAPLDRLKAHFEQFSGRYRGNGFVRGCMMGNLSAEVADHSSLIRERLADHFATWGDLIEQCIADAQRTGAIRSNLPAGDLAHFILNSWEGALLRMRVEKNDVPLRQFIDIVFGHLLV